MSNPETQSQSLAARTRWLFTPKGFPVLTSIVLGLVVGYFLSGVAGLILATLAGFGVLFLLKRPPFRLRPWQAFVTDLAPTVGKLFFSLAFLLPIADYLSLPSGHTPNTFPKYLSIVVAIPKNLFSKPAGDFFPGFVFIVVAAIVLMYWGSMNLEKRDHWLLAFGGLLLYTFSPSLSLTLTGNPGVHILKAFFGAGYYFAWVGLLLLLAAKVLPRFLKVNEAETASPAGVLNLLPPLIGLGLLSHFASNGGVGHLQLFQLFDFESTHHFVAGVLSAGVAGVSSAVIVGQADAPGGTAVSDLDGAIGPPPEEPPDVPEEPTVSQAPVSSTDPEDPQGTTVEHSPDGSVTKRSPDGTWGTQYSDGTKYVQAPDGSSLTTYPNGTTKEYSPQDGLAVTQPNGDMEITSAQGVVSTVTNHPDGSIDIVSGYGGNLHVPSEGNPEGSITYRDGGVMTFNKDGSASYTSSDGKIEIGKDDTVSMDFNDGQGNTLKMTPDGRLSAKTAEGDTITTDEDGLHAKFHDGQFVNTDLNLNPINGHLKNDSGAMVDYNTDDKGNLHIHNDQGDSADINKDGSGTVTAYDGSTIEQNSDGSGSFTTADGTKWTGRGDGTGYAEDKKGNHLEMYKDGSVTLKEATGKTTSYTADQFNQMVKQASQGQKSGTGLDAFTGVK